MLNSKVKMLKLFSIFGMIFFMAYFFETLLSIGVYVILKNMKQD